MKLKLWVWLRIYFHSSFIWSNDRKNVYLRKNNRKTGNDGWTGVTCLVFVSPGSHGVRTHKSSLWKPVLWHMLCGLYRHLLVKVCFAITVGREWFFKRLFMWGKTCNLTLPSIASPKCYISPETLGNAVKACVFWWKATVIYTDTDVLIHYTLWYYLPAGWLIIFSFFFILLAAVPRTAYFAVSDFYFVYPAENTSLHQHDFSCCSPAKLIMKLLNQHDVSVEAGWPALTG